MMSSHERGHICAVNGLDWAGRVMSLLCGSCGGTRPCVCNAVWTPRLACVSQHARPPSCWEGAVSRLQLPGDPAHPGREWAPLQAPPTQPRKHTHVHNEREARNELRVWALNQLRWKGAFSPSPPSFLCTHADTKTGLIDCYWGGC